MLFRWKLFNKRLELLKAVNRRDPHHDKSEPHKIGTINSLSFLYRLITGGFTDLVRVCSRVDCKAILPDKAIACHHCGLPCLMAGCTVCRLPVKGMFLVPSDLRGC